MIVRFVTEGGPSIGKLQPGDQILAVNGEDVKDAPRDHVIQLVRACEAQVSLLVCQPMAHCVMPGRKSTLLSAGKRAKLRSRPSRVRFAESVCVNGAPLFPVSKSRIYRYSYITYSLPLQPSAFSLGDICVPPMANVLKVFLENGQTKSFKYDSTTTVQDVVSSLLDKLCLCCGELFSLVLEHVKSLKRNKLTLLDPQESLARVSQDTLCIIIFLYNNSSLCFLLDCGSTRCSQVALPVSHNIRANLSRRAGTTRSACTGLSVYAVLQRCQPGALCARTAAGAGVASGRTAYASACAGQ